MRDPKFNPPDNIPFKFVEGDRVVKHSGDYVFEGVVLAAFRKRSGVPRYNVENDDGVVHIFNGDQLKMVKTL